MHLRPYPTAGLLAATFVLSSLSAVPARAQDFNLDVGDNLILWPTPSNAYAAAASQPGFWNNVKTPYTVTLNLLDGTPSTVTCTSSIPNAFNWPFPPLTGDDSAFMNDVQSISSIGPPAHWTFSGLSDGAYTVYTYAWAPENTGATTSVTVIGSTDPTQIIGGTWAGSPHVLGTTYALHNVVVSGGTLLVDVAGSGGSAGSVNGFQLVHDGAFTAFCAGDGTLATACPCGNNGAAGHGCENSATTGGALLVVSGTPSPDTVVLTSSGELASAFSVLLQGDASAPAGILFGDGVRCVAGNLKRLSTKNAVGGTVSYPGTGDPSISQQSANLGDPIAPGSTRYYQVYYRDPDLAFCANPPGNSWNVSGGIAIAW